MSTGAEPLLRIDVAFALPDEQVSVPLELPATTTVREAIALSGLAERFPDHIDPQSCPLGVWGEQVSDDYQLQEGDRLE